MDDLFLIKQTFHLRQIFPYTKLNLPFVASPVVLVLLSRTTQSMTNSSALNPSKAWILWSCFPLICSSPSQQLPPAPWLIPTPKFLGLLILVTTAGHTPISLYPSRTVGPHTDQYISSGLGNTEQKGSITSLVLLAMPLLMKPISAFILNIYTVWLTYLG